jgi:Uma2 family endonuclease
MPMARRSGISFPATPTPSEIRTFHSFAPRRVVKTKRYFPGPPDLAFEVMSPNDTCPEVEAKKNEYLAAGVQAVMIVDPDTRSVTIHRLSGVTKFQDVLTIDEVPGWPLPLSDLFD